MKPPKDGKLLYHLTCIDNLESIFKFGLLSRKSLEDKDFVDVANNEILEQRSKFALEHYIPFHFFYKTPFAGAVMKSNPKKEFVYLALDRDVAAKNKFKIITKHPLVKDAEICEYDEGLKKIDWSLMEGTRNYHDKNVHDTCLAECVGCYKSIKIESFKSIYTSNEKTKKMIEQLKNKYKVKIYVNVNKNFFC